ncbi:uncharacterized protein [Onthophagus taurus]|uniref:uncharacterized protein isoform X2 n=1 Tax=Onthophagus taurus TaxID=166361 RepID=UPI0039BDD340
MEATRYGLDHQRFLSYVIKEGCLQTSRALEICKNFDIDSIKNEKGLKCFIQTINERIGTYSMHISVINCEITGISYVVLNDMANDDISRMQKGFKPIELKYFEMIGRSCASCKVTIHGYCLNNFSRQEKCPHCNNDWQDIEQSNEDTSSEEE